MNTIKKLAKRWFIDAFSGMAQGLFCTLIAGTILALIAKLVGVNTYIGSILNSIANVAKTLMGAGIGIGIANSLKAPKLVMFSAGVTGFVGAFADKMVEGTFALSLGAPGNPIGAYVVALFTIEIALLYAGKTKLDIILVPLGMMILSLAGIYLAWPFNWLIAQLSTLIEIATEATPFVMGIVISVIMGILLTMPTSSAAIWVAIASGNTSDAMMIAGGAAVVGCACHMIGFAVTSYRENGFGGLIAQGLGTSMLQIPNIMRKPIIMLPEIIASAILGPVATTVFALRCTASGGGMGTSGLVGMFGVLDATQDVSIMTWLGIILLLFVLPAVITLLISELMRKKGLIKPGDMSLDI